MKDLSAKDIIEQLNLEPLPHEGGFFRRTYLSDTIIGGDLALGRHSGSAIYFLLTGAKDGVSRFHKLDTDEIYHFYGGGGAELHLFSTQEENDKSGGYQKVILGNNLLAGESCQYIVPAGTIQGLRPISGVSWVLLGTTMSPAYEDRGFELVDCDMLKLVYPQQKEIIRYFTER